MNKHISHILIPLLFTCIFPWHGLAQETRGLREIRIMDSQGKEVGLYKESHALIIGASEYGPGWPKLPGVKQDVLEIGSLLQRHGFHVLLLEDPDSKQLNQVFTDFINQYGQKPDNRLLFYFAGHGFTVKQSYGEDMGYIVPIDAPNPSRDLEGFRAKSIDMQLMEVYAKRIQSKHALFLFDSCFSGSLFSLSRAVPENISYKTSQAVRQFITSGSANEQVPDKSVFRQMFTEALQGNGDLNKDGYVTGTELGEYLQDKVVNYSRGAQHPQYGKIRNPLLDKGDFVFSNSSTGSSIIPVPYIPEKPIIGEQSSFSLADLDKKAKELEAPKVAWNIKLTDMKQSFSQVESFEKRDVPDSLKTEAWKRFVDTFPEDNPYSKEDDLLRSQALERLSYMKKGQIKLSETVEITLVSIPGGTFEMGSNDGGSGEKPVHSVTLSAFEMSATEVTQGQYKAVMGTNPSRFTGDDNMPVEQVSWLDAIKYCNALSAKKGLDKCYNESSGVCDFSKNGFRLPTEAEWEYTCRAGTTTKYNTGDAESDLARAGWYDRNSGNKNHPVGQKTQNVWGLYDMHGNVWEWCNDWYGSYSLGSATNPTGANIGSSRVKRGGGWGGYDIICRSAYRGYYAPDNGYNDLGFRVVRRP